LRTLDLAGLTEPIRLELGGTCEFADASAIVIDNIVLEIPVLMLPSVPEEEYVKIYPNPFRENAVVEFYLEAESHVKISICNLAGQTLGTLSDRSFSAGLHQISLYAYTFPKGLYLLKFETDTKLKKGVQLVRFISMNGIDQDK
jgi:hypothetical protein